MSRLAFIDEILRAVLRHFTLLVTVVILGVIASMFFALNMPRTFETTAVIQIEQPDIETSGGGSANAQILQQLQIIEQRVMARENLAGIIDKYDLFADMAAMTPNKKVNALREAATVAQITDPSLAWRPDVIPTALSITVALDDPDVAAAVANELVDNVLDQNRRRREQRARETMAFFASEETRIGAEIQEYEAEIAEFRQRNAASLGSTQTSQQAELGRLKDAELVVAREILELNSGQRANSSVFATRIARLEEQRNLLRARIDQVELVIASTPKLERELTAFERELRKLTEQYQAVTRGRAEAEMRLMLQETERSESFIVLERAVAPDDPTSPSRKKIAMAGSVAAAIFGLVIVYLMELRNPVIRSEAQLERLLGLRAVAVIPNVQVQKGIVLNRAIWLTGGVVLAMILVSIIIALIG
jgi:uncharacterized protein involved in exopolysaccharide biosynthesis